MSVLAWLARRRRYVLVLTAGIWIAMIARIVEQGGRWTAGALPVGWDFLAFLTGARILADGNGAHLYDADLQNRVAHMFVPGDYTLFDFVNPPHFAVLFLPLAFTSQTFAYVVVTIANLAMLLAALRFLGAPRIAFVYALGAFPVVYGLLGGQNCFLSLLLMALVGRCLSTERFFVAGLSAGALVYKPQLTIAFVVLFLVMPRARLRALAGFATSAFASLLVGAIASMDACMAYVKLLPTLGAFHDKFRMALTYTVRVFFEMLFPSWPRFDAAIATIVGLAVLAFFGGWARKRPPELACAGAVWATLAFTPHASIYEWTLLIAPLAWLYPRIEEQAWMLIASLLYVVALVSTPIAETMTARFGFAIQLALPVLFYTAWLAIRATRTVTS